MQPRHAFPALLVCALELFLPVAAQTPANPTPPRPTATQGAAQPPVLQVTTHLVLVNVVVHGRKNEPVTDLKKEDFTLLDDGHPQQIAVFAMESSRPPAAGTKPKVVLPPNTYTNRTDLRPTAPKAATVMLLDGLNTRFEDQAYAKKQLIAFLKQLQPDDTVALYALGRNLRILHDFTGDAGVLIDAANKHKGRAATELADSEPEDPDTGNDDLDAFIAEAEQKIADYQTINRVETTLAALEAIANHIASLPGRKNLIWISGGFPFQLGMLDPIQPGDTRERRMFTDEMERTARAVNAANLAIYPVDARGLVGQPDLSATVSGSKNARMPPPSGPSRAMQRLYDSQATMDLIADRTGGKAYYNSNDLKNAIRGAIEDAQVSYILGYYPTHNTWDGKFHEVKVAVDRKGVNVRHRAGYNALPDVPQGKEDRVKALQQAAWSALNATQLGMVVRVARDIPQPGRLRVVMSVDPHNLVLNHQGDRWKGALDLLFVQQPAPGQPTSVVNDSLDLNLTEETYKGSMRMGLRFVKDLDLASAGYFLRIAVRDAGSGSVGSVNIRTDRVKPEPPAPTAAPAEKK